eukprot:gene51152-66161_t
MAGNDCTVAGFVAAGCAGSARSRPPRRRRGERDDGSGGAPPAA